MKNVTISLNEEVARWARIYAAKHDTSVSRLVGEMIREKMLGEKNYSVAMQHYLSRSPIVLRRSDQKYPKREELYERQDLR